MAELVDAHDSKSCFARSESSILSSPTKIMKLEYNNLLELFFNQYQENKNEIFLQSLKNENQISLGNKLFNILNLSDYLRINLSQMIDVFNFRK